MEGHENVSFLNLEFIVSNKRPKVNVFPGLFCVDRISCVSSFLQFPDASSVTWFSADGPG
jgi:hypothetical protein